MRCQTLDAEGVKVVVETGAIVGSQVTLNAAPGWKVETRTLEASGGAPAIVSVRLKRPETNHAAIVFEPTDRLIEAVTRAIRDYDAETQLHLHKDHHDPSGADGSKPCDCLRCMLAEIVGVGRPEAA
jgi:hypothetical protein